MFLVSHTIGIGACTISNCRIGNRAVANHLRDHNNAAVIGDNAAEIVNNAAEIGNNVKGISEIATKVIPS